MFPALYCPFTQSPERRVSAATESTVFNSKMAHLHPVPRSSEIESGTRPVTIVSADSRDVVYIDDAASLEIIQAALKAWGLRVREERDSTTTRPAIAQRAVKDPLATWETERPTRPAPSRLENRLSPLWLPIRKPLGNEAVTAWGWFSSAA